MKKTISDITLQSYTLKPVILKQSSDIILDKRDNFTDFLSLGLICLYRSITNSDEQVIKIAKRTFQNESSGITAYINNQIIELPKDSFMSVACQYAETVANYIYNKKSINTMVLGPQISLFVSLYLYDNNISIGTKNNIYILLKKIIPNDYDMTNTIEAQRVVFELISKMLEIIIEPFENL